MKYLDLFKKQVSEPFTLEHLRNPGMPIFLREAPIPDKFEYRFNHLLLCTRGEWWWPDAFYPQYARDFVSLALETCNQFGLKWRDRYLYLTIDSGLVEPGETLRTPGWHLDGLQGDEVPVKQNVDFQFVWSDNLPTQFYRHTYPPELIDGLDLSKHNVFDSLGQIPATRGWGIISAIPNQVVLMNAYHLHRCAVAHRPITRRFMRLNCSLVPITSCKATINHNARYDYPANTTSGEIPAHLTTLKLTGSMSGQTDDQS